MLPCQARPGRAECERRPHPAAGPDHIYHLFLGIDLDYQLGDQAIEAGIRAIGQTPEFVVDEPITRNPPVQVIVERKVTSLQHPVPSSPAAQQPAFDVTSLTGR